MNLAAELQKLQELHRRGVLSDAEYAQAKAALIRNPPVTKNDAPFDDPFSDRELPGTTAKPTSNVNVVIAGIVMGAIAIGAIVYFAIIRPASGGGGGALTLKVDRVETSDHQFRVHMTATNHTKDKLKLPLFGYFFVTDDMGNQYEADPFASTFSEDVAPGATVSGYALMKKPLHPNATKLKVAFTTVFGSFAVKSVTVEDVPVR